MAVSKVTGNANYIALDPDGTAHFVYEGDSFILDAVGGGRIIFLPEEMLLSGKEGMSVFRRLKLKAEEAGKTWAAQMKSKSKASVS